MYFETFRQMKKQLGQLDKWLDAAAAFAKTKSFDPNVFLGLPARAGPVRVRAAGADRHATPRSSARRASRAKRRRRTPTPSRRSTSSTRACARSSPTSTASPPRTSRAPPTRVVTQPRWEGKVMTGARLLRRARRPELLLPPHARVRDPPPQRRRRRQARLPRRAHPAHAVIGWRPGETSGKGRGAIPTDSS